MQSVTRKVGKLMNRGPGDNAKVSVLLNDYEDADRVLSKIIENTRSWQESWNNLVSSQLDIAVVYVSLYDPIVGASDGHGRQAQPTSEEQLRRTFALKEAYMELRSELTEGIASIEKLVMGPCIEARNSIGPIRKTIKKRENKRLDVEKCQDKVHKLHRKMPRSPKDDAQLAKSEDELMVLNEEFDIADAHLRETLPPIITAAFALVPPVLATHIRIQNELLGLYYTVLHGYCEENGYQSPPPPMSDVIACWSEDFQPAKRQVENIPMIARGKGIREPLRLDGSPEGPGGRKLSAPPPTEGLRRTSTGLIPGANGRGRIGSAQAPAATSPIPSPQPSPKIGPRPDLKSPNFGGLLKPTDFTTASDLGRSPGTVSPSQQRVTGDYFAGRVPPSPASTVASNFSQGSNSVNGAAIAKKKPPPPPPKRIPSGRIEEYVIAQYDFTGQGAGDLSFREGDRIKIVKKTQTDQDWWTGEVRGVKGSFPANYCKPA
ncbi:unnamed protein product [Discula destructiva]